VDLVGIDDYRMVAGHIDPASRQPGAPDEHGGAERWFITW